MQKIDGVELRTACWRASHTAGDANPILFFNGIGANLELAAGLADMFPDRAFLTFDAPGVGMSPVTTFPYHPWSVARWGRELMDRYEIETADIIGFSWGGAMAQQFSMQYRNRVGRLVLCATSAGAMLMPGISKSFDTLAALSRDGLSDRALESVLKVFEDEITHEASAELARLFQPDPIGVLYQAMAFLGWSNFPLLGLLNMPSLVVCGDKDSLVPETNARMLQMALPDSRLEVIESAGHMFFLTHTTETERVLRGFLDERVMAGPAAS